MTDEMRKLSRKQLIEIMKKHHIRGHSKLKKGEIISELHRLSNDGSIEGGDLRDTISSYYNRAKDFITSRLTAIKGVRLDYRPKDREFIAKNKGAIITSITVYRAPVESYVKKLANVLTFGKFGEIMKKHYDELYHLFLRITLSNGADFTLEKNATIEINIFDPKRDTNEGTEKLELKLDDKKIPFGDFLTKAQASTTPDIYFKYNAISTNCQQFLTVLLKANGLESINPEANKFIFQDMSHLRNGLSEFQKKIFKGTTDLAGIADVVISGAGLKKKKGSSA